MSVLKALCPDSRRYRASFDCHSYFTSGLSDIQSPHSRRPETRMGPGVIGMDGDVAVCLGLSFDELEED